MAKAKAVAYKNRIVGHGELPVEDILFNPLNWRIHPQDQQDALDGVLAQVGWVQNVVVNRTTGNLVDGHLRVLLADRAGDAVVPVTFVELTSEEEELVLASLDPIGAMAVTDNQKLAELLSGMESDHDGLQALLDELAEITGETDFSRPDFSGLVEKLTSGTGESALDKDGNWFYVEFYGQDERYESLYNRMRECGLVPKADHQLDADLFQRIVEAYLDDPTT